MTPEEVVEFVRHVHEEIGMEGYETFADVKPKLETALQIIEALLSKEVPDAD